MSETLFGLLAAAAHDHAPAATLGGTTITWADLHRDALRHASLLSSLGVQRGDRVAIQLRPSLDVLPLIFGCARVGAPFVILHDQVHGPALDHVLGDAAPALFVGDDPSALTRARAAGVPVLEPDRLTGAAPGELGPEPLAVDPVCLIYTSGSTGLPKAVVSTHGQMVFAARAIQECLAYREDDVVFLCLPLSFDYGLYQVFLALLARAKVHLAEPSQIGPMLVRGLREAGATVLPAVPSLAQGLARLLRRSESGLPSLRLLTNTGAAMPDGALAALRDALPALRVHLMFGLTECKRATIMPVDEDLRRPGACGFALPGTEVFTVDDDGQRLPPGEIGEITVRGPNVMAGYWRRPELTAARFPRADDLFPELRTGDYGRVDADGFLYFSGRRDDQYKANGFRVSAAEVEAACQRVSGVVAAAVLPPGGDRAKPVLFYVGDLTPDQVVKQLREEIEPYKAPDWCVAVAALPLNRNGKVDRAALPALL
ncbi:class I adenylate-forming enzyme family protein [Streptosporangium saharense]|uniref:class I adenylate-forming enzyme family protein n=1 Tax=Streptosporangium saharense TaxID=1706840 RepID=UPI003319BCD8